MTNSATWGDVISSASDGFELHPPGNYDFTIVKAEYSPSSSGNPMLKLQSVIMTGPQAGKKVYHNMVFANDNPGLMGIRVQELKALGLDPDSFQGTLDSVVEQLSGLIINKSFNADLTHREWNNQNRNDIGIMNALKAGASQVATPTAPAAPTPAAPAAPGGNPPMPDSAAAPQTQDYGPDESPF